MPLESRLEPIMLVLRAPKTQKVWFYNRNIKLFAIGAFRYFEALEDLIGPMLALLGPFDSKMAPEMDPELAQKS